MEIIIIINFYLNTVNNWLLRELSFIKKKCLLFDEFDNHLREKHHYVKILEALYDK